MFFLVPYSLIDREDLNVIQKMCVLYLARHYDEKGGPQAIDEEELAEKLRVTTSEIKLNLQVLVSKGILAANPEVPVAEPVFGRFDEFILDELVKGGAFTDEEESGEEESGEEESEGSREKAPHDSPQGAGEEAPEKVREEEAGERELNELLSRVGEVEKRVRERATRLRVKARDLPPDADEIESLKAKLRSIEIEPEEGEAAAPEESETAAPEESEEVSGGRRKAVKNAYAFYEAGADGKMHFPKEYRRTKEMMEANELLEYLASSGIDRAREKKQRITEPDMTAIRKRILSEESEGSLNEDEERKKRPDPRFRKASSVYQQNSTGKKKRKAKKQQEKEV